MKTIRGPGIFLAQFIGEQPPFDTLAGICGWAAGLGFKAVQMPTNDPRFFNLKAAAESQAYCDDLRGALAGAWAGDLRAVDPTCRASWSRCTLRMTPYLRGLRRHS